MTSIVAVILWSVGAKTQGNGHAEQNFASMVTYVLCTFCTATWYLASLPDVMETSARGSRRRGPYRRYLVDPSVAVLRKTKFNWRRTDDERSDFSLAATSVSMLQETGIDEDIVLSEEDEVPSDGPGRSSDSNYKFENE